MPERGRISALQAVTLLAIMQISVAILVPGPLAPARRDAWLGTLAMNLYQQVAYFLALALASRFPGQTLPQMAGQTLGRAGGTALGLLYAAFYLHFCSAVLRSFSDFLLTMALPLTPLGAVALTMGLLAAYGARHGIEVLGRAGQVILPLIVAVIGFILILVAP